MSLRSAFIDYVRHGGDKPVVSLQIGAGAGFDAKLAGKPWFSDAALDDTIRAYETVGGLPLYNIGLPDLGSVVPELVWQRSTVAQGKARRQTQSFLETPYGILATETIEEPLKGCVPTRYPLAFGDSLDVVKWMAEQSARAIPYVGELLAPTLSKLHPHGPVSVQWNIQPFELLGLANAVDEGMMATSDPEEYRAVCDIVRDVNIELVDRVIAAGADFVFLGGPGAEAASPFIYETFLVPDSRAITRAVREAGGLVYSHICSPVEPFLSAGYYNEMGLDLFETLTPPPAGNVTDLEAARRMLPESMCTRGNIGLDVLLNGSPDDVAREAQRIINDTRGYKHMVAASDYLFYDIPLENVRALVETVQG